MPNWDALTKYLTGRGFAVSRFATAAAAADYLDRRIDGVTVGFGGSATLDQMGLYERLATHNAVKWHWRGDELAAAAGTEVYLSSVNALAETGELINIDGVGNRTASTLFGHKKLYLVVGSNKVAPNYEAALWRARNIAAPKNARRLNKKTPCAKEADRCYDCSSPDRICRGLVVLWEKPSALESVEVVLVEESLGF